ncbi:hypothetical protein PUW92_01870 [Metamycoplasma hyosynoviae]|nr:hypothetical protein [Metamycoplasma hyosynoviae]MDD7898143.1 hypothetical protein [Metamycoplasma hyosynoviae]
MYLVKGNEEYLIDKRVNKIKSDLISKHPNMEVLYFSYSMYVEEIVDVLVNVDIFASTKLIIFKNIDFLNAKSHLYSKEKASETKTGKNKVKYEKYNEKFNKSKKELFEDIIEMIEEKSPDTHIIFSQLLKKYDKEFEPSTVYKYLEANAKVFEENKVSNYLLGDYIDQIIKEKGGTIERLAKIQMLAYLPNDLKVIENEIDKLLLIDKNIKLSMLDSADLSLNDVDFAFQDAFLSMNNYKRIIKAFYEQLNSGLTISQIIAKIGNILYDIQKLFIYKTQYDSLDKIAEITKIHKYRLSLCNQFINKVSYLKVKEWIYKLAELDIKIKSGRIDEMVGIKTFILELIK